MRVLVCGGRTYRNYRAVTRELAHLRPTDVLVHGGAPGADTLAAKLWPYQAEVWPAEWDQFGKAAGPIRNRLMLESGIDLVIAFPGGRGTADLTRRALELGVWVMSIADDAEV